MRPVGGPDIRLVPHARPIDIDQVRIVEAPRNLRPDAILLVMHPARDHLLAHKPLLVCEIGCPKLGRVKPRIFDLLAAIPLRKILAQILAELHAMRLGIAGVA